MKSSDDLSDFVVPDYEGPNTTSSEPIKSFSLFDYINDLSFDKNDLAGKQKAETGKFPTEFVPYVCLKAFGNYRDTVLLANEINIRFGEIDAENQYKFYLYAVPKRKRFAKFFSEDKKRSEAILALAKYYKWSSGEAEANLHMFTKDQIESIIRRTDTDGNKRIGQGTKETGTRR